LRGDDRHPSLELAEPQGHFFAFFFPFFFAAFFFFGMIAHLLSLWGSGADVRSEDPPRRGSRWWEDGGEASIAEADRGVRRSDGCGCVFES
jgi:hypothetical protein